MAPTRILDSHIHLWPSTATTPKDHGWMTPDLFLAKRHGIQDYRTVVQSSNAASSLQGFIYVETDRYLPTKTPKIDPNASKKDTRKILEDWAKAPLDELQFLRRIVEERPEEGDGFKQDDGGLMKGAVVWAPFHLPVFQFETYLELAEEVSGPKLWERVVGFRYLLQGKEKGEVQRLVSSEDWIENIVSLAKGRGGKGWAFDVGVDVNRDGHEPLGAVGEMVKTVRDREAKSGGETKPVRFVLSKFCIILCRISSRFIEANDTRRSFVQAPPHSIKSNRSNKRVAPCAHATQHRSKRVYEAVRRIQ